MASLYTSRRARTTSLRSLVRLRVHVLLLMLFALATAVCICAATTATTTTSDSSSSANHHDTPSACAVERSDAASSSCADNDSTAATTHISSANSTYVAPLPPRCTVVSRADAKQKHVVFVSIAIKGHAQPLLRIASEMRARGYRVSFATHESGKDWAASYNLPFLSAGPFPISADDLRSKLKAMTRDASTFRGILTMANDIYVAAARPMFDALLPQLQANPPDLLVFDIATLGAQDLAHLLALPYIINSPSILFDVGARTPSDVPAWGTGYGVRDMSLWHRCMNLLFPRLLSVALTPPFMQLNKIRYDLALRPYRSQHDVFKGARILLNTAFGLEHAQPLSPLIEAVGPILPLRQVSKIGSSLQNWLDAAAAAGSRVIYVNLGTLAYIDAWQAQALIDGLTLSSVSSPSTAPQRVLWILPTDQRSILPVDVPPTLKVKSPSGVANHDVVAHAAVALVVSHCGMVSAQEALVAHKPLLCIPFLVDQPDVAARVVDAGAGLALDKNALSPGSVQRAVHALLVDDSYTKAATRVGRLLELAGGTNRAIAVIDTALRLGTRHLETLDLSAPWHKTAMLDVWTVYAALFCLLAFVVRIHWLLLYFAASEAIAFVSSAVFGPPTTAPAPVALPPRSKPKDKTTATAADSSSTSSSATGTNQHPKESEASQDATESESSETLTHE